MHVISRVWYANARNGIFGHVMTRVWRWGMLGRFARGAFLLWPRNSYLVAALALVALADVLHVAGLSALKSNILLVLAGYVVGLHGR